MRTTRVAPVRSGGAPRGPAAPPRARQPWASAPTAVGRHGGGVGGGLPFRPITIRPLRPPHAPLPANACAFPRGATPGPLAPTVHVPPRRTQPGDGAQRGAGCGEGPGSPGSRSETPWGLSQKPWHSGRARGEGCLRRVPGGRGHGSGGAVIDLLKTASGLCSVRGLATGPRAGKDSHAGTGPGRWAQRADARRKAGGRSGSA